MAMKIVGVDLGIPCFPNSPHLGMTQVIEVISETSVVIPDDVDAMSYEIDTPQLKAGFSVKVDRKVGSLEHQILHWELTPELKAQGYICAGLNLIAEINTTSRRRYTNERKKKT